MFNIGILAYLYLSVLKASELRTPGYWLTGLRIVDLKGRRPSLARMTFRLVFWILGPIHPLYDLLYVSNDGQRQTLRDRLVGTYVVRRSAEPAGRGRKSLERLGFMGMMLLLPVVRPAIDDDEADASDSGVKDAR